jgi:hypothetical protein
LYSSRNIIATPKLMRMRWAVHAALMSEKKDACRLLAGKLEGKRPIVRGGRTREDNVKMDLSEIQLGGMAWIDLAQD